jgi:ubiquinone/menaquinone biosynthesis C-methylase UbiE
VHEYSVRDSRLASAVWNAVALTVIIPAGRLRTGDAGLYQYLRRSVNEFDGVTAFRKRLSDNGFTAVESDTMPGWQRNIVHTFRAEAPR